MLDFRDYREIFCIPEEFPSGIGPRGWLDNPETEKETIMKIYIWEGALADWTGGMIVAIAPNLRVAKAAARKAYGRKSDQLEQDLRQKPEIVPVTDTTPAQAWICFGGA